MNQLKVYAIDGIVPVVDPTAHTPVGRADRRRDRGPDCYVGLRKPARRLRATDPGARLEPAGHLRDAWFSRHRYGGREDGHIGHGAVLHGCRAGRNASGRHERRDHGQRGDRRVIDRRRGGLRQGRRRDAAAHVDRRHAARRSARSPRRRCAGRAREPRPTRTSPAAAWPRWKRPLLLCGGRFGARPHAGRGAAGGTAVAGRLRPAAQRRHGHERVPYAQRPGRPRRPAGKRLAALSGAAQRVGVLEAREGRRATPRAWRPSARRR